MAQKTRRGSRRRHRRAWVVLAAVAALAVGALALWHAGGMTGSTELVEHQTGASPDITDVETAPSDATTDTRGGAAQGSALLVVDVDGAVLSPGVYEVSAGEARVRDAVTAAGGLAEDADTTRLNLAAPLQDGQKVHVPRMGETVAADPSMSAAGQTMADASNSSGSTLININTAHEEELKQLPGVGDATAAAIVKDRQEHGRFTSVDDLMRVSGIGQKKLEKLRARICV